MDWFHHIKLRNFCASKDIIKKVKDSLHNGRKKLANRIWLGLPDFRDVWYPECLKDSWSSTIKEQQLKNWGKDMNTHFSRICGLERIHKILSIYHKALKPGSWRDICTWMFIAVLFTVATSGNKPKCPSTDEWKNKMCLNGEWIEWYVNYIWI